MPFRKTTIRRKRDHFRLTLEQIEHLFNGSIVLGYHENVQPTDCSSVFRDDAEAEECWTRHRDLLMQFWSCGVQESDAATDALWYGREWLRDPAAPATRPWAWWKWDEGKTKPPGEPADHFLMRLDLLTAREKSALAQRAAAAAADAVVIENHPMCSDPYRIHFFAPVRQARAERVYRDGAFITTLCRICFDRAQTAMKKPSELLASASSQ